MRHLYSARIRKETPSRADYFPQNYFRDPRIYYLSSPYLNCSFLPVRAQVSPQQNRRVGGREVLVLWWGITFVGRAFSQSRLFPLASDAAVLFLCL